MKKQIKTYTILKPTVKIVVAPAFDEDTETYTVKVLTYDRKTKELVDERLEENVDYDDVFVLIDEYLGL